MRTHGTIQEIFDAAKTYYNGTAEDGKPHNAEVRYDGSEWYLESGLSSAEDIEVCCDLEIFDSFFCGEYQNDEYKIDEDTEEAFLRMISEE